MFAHRVQLAWAKRLGKHEPTTARSVYRRFLTWANKKLAPRESWQSPHEYLAILAGLIPDAAPELAYITDNYVQARYGGYELAPGTTENMTQAFTQIRKARRANRIPAPHESQEGLQ